jgi:hypothetical protein
VLAFDTTAARTFGVLKATLERRGTPLAEPDLRIASIALSRGLILVTRNVRHFQRIRELTVENWIEEHMSSDGDWPILSILSDRNPVIGQRTVTALC